MGHNSSPRKGSNPLLTVASVRYSTGLLTGAAVVPSVQNIFILLYHTLERATMKAYGEGRNLTPAIQKTLNRSSPKLVQVIKSGCLPICKILSKSVRGFRFLRMRDFAPLGAKLLGYLGGGYLTMATAETRAPILTQKTRFRARKGLFGVAKPASKTYNDY